MFSNVESASFEGDLCVLAERVTDNWLLGLRETNPAILDMFKYDDDSEIREKLSWSGEFPGKYLTSCCMIYRITHDKKLLVYA